MKQSFVNRKILPMRLGALGLASSMLWSLGLAGAARAVTYKAPVNPGHTRALTPAEMTAISGSVAMTGTATAQTINAYDGGGFPWQGSVGGTNLANGNKLTSLPLVGWTARGGLPVAFTLYHNSHSTRNAELGHKGSGSYDIRLVGGGALIDGTTPSYASVVWGDETSYTFAYSGSSYARPAGIHDSLVQNVDGSFTLTTPAQVAYHFDGSSLLCDGISDENGNTVTIGHNTDGTVSTVTDPNSRTLTLAYDSSHRLSTVTDPLSRVWTLHYNSGSALTSVDWPTLASTTYSVSYGYNSAYDITGVTDLRGNSRSLTYNADDSLATEADNAGNTTGYAYTSTATTITDPNSHATVYAYDSSGRVSSVTDPASHSEYYAYDTDNNKTQVQDKRGKYWNYTYDAAGNALTATDPLSHTTTLTYNGHHKMLTKTLPGGESVALTYDTNDNPTAVAQKNSSGTTLATTSYTIGSYGLVSAKTDSNSHTTYYGYDTYGDLANVTTPLGNVTQWGHDALGAVTSREDAMSRTTGYTLDNWERTTTVTYPDSSTHTFAYDGNSDLTQFVDATGTTTRVYDSDNRMTSESKGGSTVVSHTYDATSKLGLLSTTTDSNSRTITYAYTSRDQLYTVAETAGTTTYAYDNGGLETGIANANGSTVANVYDDAGRLTSVTNKNASATTLSSFSYGYNSDDLRTSCTEASGDVVTYGYDGLLHLSSESRTGTYAYTNAYTVDGEGNRTAQTAWGASSSFTYDSDDELTQVTGGLTRWYQYNANGDQTGFSGSAYAGVPLYNTRTYDYDDQCTSPGHGYYYYDALGRRVSRDYNGQGDIVTYQYDGDAVLLEKQGGAVSASYTYGNALLRETGQTPMFDGLGAGRTVTDGSGGGTGSLTTSAFGQTVAWTGSGANAGSRIYGYGASSGYRSDGEIGVIKVGARYYDTEVGRFTTRDTDLDEAPYVYCAGDPVNCVDPDGHAPKSPTKGHRPLPKPKPINGPAYPPFWPKKVPIWVGPPTKVTGGGGIHAGPVEANGSGTTGGPIQVELDGPVFWNSLSSATRSKMKKFNDLQQEAQKDQGN